MLTNNNADQMTGTYIKPFSLLGNNTKVIKKTIQLEKKNNKLNETPSESESVLKIQTANQWLEEAKKEPIPKMLCSNFWYEGELAVMFASAGVGKSLLGVQIADIITGGRTSEFLKCEAPPQPVLYLDLELTKKQFEERYSNNYQDHYKFSDLLYRVEIDPKKKNFKIQDVFQSIELAVKQTGARVLIVDNITYLKENLETAKDAIPFLKFLSAFNNSNKLSILCIAHTPKRPEEKPLSRNDLSGSSQISNMVSSIFAIGKSVKDEGIRYLKQIKSRQRHEEFNSNNVAVFEISKDHNFVSFDFLGLEEERQHLKPMTKKQKANIQAIVREYRKAHPDKSGRKIARDLGMSKSTVHRILDQEDEFILPIFGTAK